jgi:hypothetical protein
MGVRGIGDRKPKKTWDPRENLYTHIADALYERLLGKDKYAESGWILGWRNTRPGKQGILDYTGIASKDAARKYELYYGMPIHRLLDGRPRAIPWELDLWLIKFSEAIERAANESGVGTKQPYSEPSEHGVNTNGKSRYAAQVRATLFPGRRDDKTGTEQEDD